jgi:DNA repair photolyase
MPTPANHSIAAASRRIAGAIETGTPHVSKRIEALHWLQTRGFRTFGMICPSFPQVDYDTFSAELCDANRVKRCDHIWAEPINVRGPTLPRMLEALR